MAALRKRNGRWQVQIRKTGKAPVTKTFNLKSDALLWARETESQVERGEKGLVRNVLKQITLSELIDRYVQEVLPSKKAYVQEKSAIELFREEPFAKIKLSKLTGNEIQRYAQKRLSTVTADTFLRQFGVFRHMINIARSRWGIPVSEALVTSVSLPSPSKGRTRRLVGEEGLRLMSSARECENDYLEAVITIALETAMRQSEILRIQEQHINFELRTLLIPETKNGKPRTIPLSKLAFSILSTRVLSERGLIFPHTSSALRQSWRRLVKRIDIEDLRFHDLRHEAISRLFEKGLNLAEVMLISGHTDHRMLLRYTHLEASRLVGRI